MQSSQLLKMAQVGRGSQTMAVLAVMFSPLKYNTEFFLHIYVDKLGEILKVLLWNKTGLDQFQGIWCKVGQVLQVGKVAKSKLDC